jgi:hypothetical protein
MAVPRDLIFAAVQLARSAGPDWDSFVVELEKYAATQRDLCVASPIDVLAVAQGRAQGVSVLTHILHDCKHEAEVLERAAKQNKKSPLGPG